MNSRKAHLCSFEFKLPSVFNIGTMAGDTRDSNPLTPRGPPPGATEPPEHVKTPKVYEVFHSPPQNANALPEGSGLNTAGGHERPPALADAVKTIKLEDFKKVHMYPCVRESLLMGIGGGFGIGGIRALWGGMFFSMSVEKHC
jgi:cytochrome c oxidase assembly protein subunit 20